MKYVAELHHALEVTLLGGADLAYWTAHLAPLDLHPSQDQGRAQVQVSAVRGRFMGVTFRELSVAVYVARDPDGRGHDGAYLAGAWNSSRAFAWFERTCFATPYQHGTIDVRAERASVRLSVRGATTLDASMAGADRQPRGADMGWAGPVFLPGGKLFFARIGGEGRIYPFNEAAGDRCALTDSPDAPTVHQLVDSHFTPRQWVVRPDADHAKSKTFRRDRAGDPWQFSGLGNPGNL
jgi:hypothetical protein